MGVAFYCYKEEDRQVVKSEREPCIQVSIGSQDDPRLLHVMQPVGVCMG